MATHAITLSNAAASELLVLVNSRGLLTKPVQIRRVSRFVREHLLAIEEPKGDQRAQLAWADRPAVVGAEISESTRDALKALVSAAAEKGALGATLGIGELLDVLGLAEEA